MARSKAQDAAISAKIAMLRREGLTKDRATAAAFRMFRAGEIQPLQGGVSFFEVGVALSSGKRYRKARDQRRRRRRPRKK